MSVIIVAQVQRVPRHSHVYGPMKRKAAKRARIWRSGKDFYLPVRTSEAALARDQALLDAVDKNLSLQEAEEAVSKIRRQREVETAGGEVEGSSQGKEGGVKKQR